MRHKRNSAKRAALLQQRSRSWCKAQEKKIVPLFKFTAALESMFRLSAHHIPAREEGVDIEAHLTSFRAERPGLFESRHVRARKLAAMLRARRT